MVCWINVTFLGSKCIHYVIDYKILHIKGSGFVSEALELRAGIAGIRAFSFNPCILYFIENSIKDMNYWGLQRDQQEKVFCFICPTFKVDYRQIDRTDTVWLKSFKTRLWQDVFVKHYAPQVAIKS